MKTQPPWRKLAVNYDAINTFIGLATGSGDIRLDLLEHKPQVIFVVTTLLKWMESKSMRNTSQIFPWIQLILLSSASVL